MSSVCKDDIKLIQTLSFYLQKPKYKCSSDTKAWEKERHSKCKIKESISSIVDVLRWKQLIHLSIITSSTKQSLLSQ